jgi:hypothetical protein
MTSRHRLPLRGLLGILGLATALAGCTGPADPVAIDPPPPVVAAPTADSLALPVVPGGHLWLHGDARDSLRTPADTLVRFTVADTSVATVDTLGQVTGRRAGRTVVTATAAGRSTRLAVVVRPVRYGEVHPSTEGGGCALTMAGEALCWGANLNGTLGTETLRSCGWISPGLGYQCGSWPSDAPTFVRTRERFASLAVAWGRRCGLTADGRALCWGARPETTSGIVPCADALPRGRCDYAPREDPGAQRWARVAVGALRFAGTTCALDAAGAPWCWGYDWGGNAGSGRTTAEVATVPTPTPVRGAPRLRALALGPLVSCGLDADDAVWCWGTRSYLGNDPADGAVPSGQPVRAAGGMRFAALSIHDGGCGLTREGEAWCWWSGTRPAPAAPGLRFATISAGEVSACGVTADGEGWCWPYARPTQRVGGDVRFRTLAVQEYEACGIAVDGLAHCLRYQADGEDPSRTTIGPPRALAGQE